MLMIIMNTLNRKKILSKQSEKKKHIKMTLKTPETTKKYMKIFSKLIIK